MSFVVKTFTNKKEMNLYLIKYRKNRLEEKLAKAQEEKAEKAEKDLKQANKKDGYPDSIHELLYNTIPPNRFMNNGTDARRRSRRLHNEGLSKTMVPTVRRENQNVYDGGESNSHIYNNMATDECSRVIDAAADLPSGDDDGIWSVPSEEHENGFIDDQDGFIDDPYYRNNNIVHGLAHGLSINSRLRPYAVGSPEYAEVADPEEFERERERVGSIVRAERRQQEEAERLQRLQRVAESERESERETERDTERETADNERKRERDAQQDLLAQQYERVNPTDH
jgi:hypothetical protein